MTIPPEPILNAALQTVHQAMVYLTRDRQSQNGLTRTVGLVDSVFQLEVS